MGESCVRPISPSFFQERDMVHDMITRCCQIIEQERDMGHHDMITLCCQIIEGKLLQ